ncbi:MAG: tyrosinase family protein [Candidatus Dormibacteraeota bacterium]|nr:tyrosinase family protein [Candidatus Dormibacteraeota bacterium]MDQ6921410.1 tyrosinase family protein [Candidatus Dormibacteraeota bacterium]
MDGPMTGPAAAPAQIPAHPPGTVRHRISAAKLNQHQLDGYREAIRQAGQFSSGDNRGFQWFAGQHGIPGNFCQHHVQSEHGRRFFLPWHRAYLYFFELALQDLVPDVTQPWWDWTFDPQNPTWIPDVYGVATLPGGAPNPLFSQPINVRPPRPGQPPATVRAHSGPDPRVQPTQDQLTALLNEGDFFTFSLEVENIHDGIHGATGGTMANIAWAAYDPIFFAHHTMIDRLWSMWQDLHGAPGPTQDMLGEALPPWAMTVQQTLDVGNLGYSYAATSVRVPGTP